MSTENPVEDLRLRELQEERKMLQTALDAGRVIDLHVSTIVPNGAQAKICEVLGYHRIFILVPNKKDLVTCWTIIPEWESPDIKMHSVVFDMTTKETVMITNGICRNCVRSVPNHVCTMAPFEAIALRAITFQPADEPGTGKKRSQKNAQWDVCWTHVRVLDHKLLPIGEAAVAQFKAALGAARRRI